MGTQVVFGLVGIDGSPCIVSGTVIYDDGVEVVLAVPPGTIVDGDAALEAACDDRSTVMMQIVTVEPNSQKNDTADEPLTAYASGSNVALALLHLAAHAVGL